MVGVDYLGYMAVPDQREDGVNPEEFGSARVDAAALLDADLGDVDWFVPPAGAVLRTLDVPSGKLAAMALETLMILLLCWCPAPPAPKRTFHS